MPSADGEGRRTQERAPERREGALQHRSRFGRHRAGRRRSPSNAWTTGRPAAGKKVSNPAGLITL